MPTVELDSVFVLSDYLIESQIRNEFPCLPLNRFNGTRTPSFYSWISLKKFFSVYIEIFDFSGFTTVDMKEDASLQKTVEILTHRAIALSAGDNGVYSDDFDVSFANSSGSLTIEKNLSLDYSLYLTALKYVIQNEDEELSSVIKDSLVDLYPNNTAITVSISLNKFRFFLHFHLFTVNPLFLESNTSLTCTPWHACILQTDYRSNSNSNDISDFISNGTTYIDIL